MSFLVKQSTQLKLPVLLISSTDHIAEKTGVVSPTVYMLKGDATVSAITPVSWTEVSSSNMPGLYELVIGASDLAVLGPTVIYISGTGSDKAKREIFVSANVMDDVAANTLQVRRLNEGKLVIDGVANTMTAYAPDGTTILQQWNLKDSRGNATHTNPFQRLPIISIP